MTQWGLDTLFNPAKRHMDEEKRRLQATREEVGDASGGKRIDFESGKVKIRRTAPKAAAAEAEAETEADDDAVATGDADEAVDQAVDVTGDATEGAETEPQTKPESGPQTD